MKGKTIGILGGGQLGRMMSIAAKQMGCNVIILDPSENCPAKQVADEHIQSKYDDYKKLEIFFEKCDVITYEFENIPFTTIKKFEDKYNIAGGHKVLYFSQNRFREKECARKLDIPLAKYEIIKNKNDLMNSISNMGVPAVLKTCEGGYDGKGQVVIKSENDIDEALKLIKEECILEKFVEFDMEISVIAHRSMNGEVSFLPVPKNVHKNNILRMSILPNDIASIIVEKAQKYIEKILVDLKVVGTLCVEFFVKGKEVLFNEMAPRPHNSGHYSIDACNTSQFEQHIRAILGWKLGETDLKHPTVMVNILGQHMGFISDFLTTTDFKDAKLHLYGKDEIKENRKMGHITFINKTETEVKELIFKKFKM